MKILVIGSDGQLGRCLKDCLNDINFDTFYNNSQELDVTNFLLTEEKISSLMPHVIINASAYTSVDLAESNKKEADTINFLAVKNLATISKKFNIILIHISTDYVFDGKSEEFYTEECATNPQSAYGLSKLNGEKAIFNSKANFIIIRTAWLFSEHGSNFLKTMISLLNDRDSLSMVSDQIGTPTYAQDLAKSIYSILIRIKNKNQKFGLYHFAGDSKCSWYEFASYICKELIKIDNKYGADIKAITTKDYPTPAKRPANSCLNSNKLCKSYNLAPSDWKKGVRESIKKIHLHRG
jgi:dTDP-4-dehydrorhamnose reductase